jgi:hypothetical protein
MDVHIGDAMAYTVSLLRACEHDPETKTWIIGVLAEAGIVMRAKGGRGRPQGLHICLSRYVYRHMDPKPKDIVVENFGRCARFCAGLMALPVNNIWAYVTSKQGISRVASEDRAKHKGLENQATPATGQSWVPPCAVPPEVMNHVGKFVVKEDGQVMFEYRAASVH